MKDMTLGEIAALPVEQRIQLVEDLWDSIAELPEAVEIPEWHKRELESRLEAYRKSPEAGSPWAEVRKRILG